MRRLSESGASRRLKEFAAAASDSKHFARSLQQFPILRSYGLHLIPAWFSVLAKTEIAPDQSISRTFYTVGAKPRRAGGGFHRTARSAARRAAGDD